MKTTALILLVMFFACNKPKVNECEFKNLTTVYVLNTLDVECSFVFNEKKIINRLLPGEVYLFITEPIPCTLKLTNYQGDVLYKEKTTLVQCETYYFNPY